MGLVPFDFSKFSSLASTDEAKDTQRRRRSFCLTLSDNTQPKQVLIGKGEPGGSCRRPWSNTRVNMSALRSPSMYPSTTNSGSAKRRSDRSLQLVSIDTGIAGYLVVNRRRTVASAFHRCPENLPTFNDFWFATVSVTTDLEDSECSGPPIPANRTRWPWRGKYTLCQMLFGKGRGRYALEQP